MTTSHVFNGDATIYAHWFFTITFNTNPVSGGTVTPANATTPPNAPSHPCHAAAPPGYPPRLFTLGGTGGTEITTSYVFTVNTTIYAQWTSNSAGGGGQYEFVTIGGKKWMAKNLNIVTGDSWCYDGSADNCAKYGRLYTWEAARTACPTGWRLPSRTEWQNLVDSAGGNAMAGSRLKSRTGWTEFSGISSTDEYGFSALPGGFRITGGTFRYAGDDGDWWTATEDGSGNAYYRNMGYRSGFVGENNDSKGYAFSVRCVAD
ncbi:hypothetical protein R80B4_02364 [Fibrobacteres bacterium R8-0-B4]